jgi:ribonuclease HI
MYTDGASRGNPGRGGYGTILMWKGRVKVIAGLEALTKDNLDIIIYSDSQYVVRAVEEGWLIKWIGNNFKGGKKNKDLWLRFYELQQKNNIRFQWVRGHSDNPYNNRCDELATSAADGNGLLIDEEFENEFHK